VSVSAGRSWLLAVLVLCSAWAAWLSFAVLEGRLPERWARRSLPRAPTAVPAGDASGDLAPAGVSATTPASTSASAGETTAASGAKLARYVVCGREEGPPALAELHGLTAHGTRLAVHCGSSVHVIALSADGSLRPERVAQLSASSPSPAEAPRAVAPLAADLDGDGRRDLLAPMLLVDAQGNPRGGALHLLHARPEGGFDPARRALELAPGAVARLAAAPGDDLALIQLAPAQLARSNELWIVRGGPAPLRSETRTAVGVGASALAVADLDRDGRDDVAVASEGEGRVRLFRGGAASDAEPTQWEVPAVREAFSADLDGDGARDLVLVGTRVWLVLATKSEPLAPRELAASDGLRELHAVDVDRDRKLDLVGYAHPALVALLQREQLGFERRSVATLSGDAAVYSARVLALASREQPSGPPIAWITMLSSGNEPAVEIAFAHELTIGSRLELAPRAQALPDAPLVERFGLR
jgi:hypothetical protein